MTAHQLLARLADHVVVTSEAYAERVTGNRHPPVSIVPWGVDPGRFEPAGPSAMTAPNHSEGCSWDSCGPYKGAAVAIDAVADQPDLALTIVGRGPEEASLRRRIADAAALTSG